jgi:predicted transcriptional regulator
MKWTPYDYAKKTTVECDADLLASEAARIFMTHNIGSILVKSPGGGYIGLLTDRLFFKAVAEGKGEMSGKKVGELGLEPIVLVNKSADIDEVRRNFRKTPSGRLVMTDDEGRVVGLLKKKNIDRFSIFKAAMKKALRR